MNGVLDPRVHVKGSSPWTNRSTYEKNPTVFPVLDGDNLVGTCFVWKTRRNNFFVISRSLHARRDYTCLIPVEEGNKQKIFKIGLNRGKEGADFVATAVKNHPRVPNFVESSQNSDADVGRQIYMVSCKARCKKCKKLQTKSISKYCRVEKETTMVYTTITRVKEAVSKTFRGVHLLSATKTRWWRNCEEFPG